jgi:hypothetical protein
MKQHAQQQASIPIVCCFSSFTSNLCLGFYFGAAAQHWGSRTLPLERRSFYAAKGLY